MRPSEIGMNVERYIRILDHAPSAQAEMMERFRKIRWEMIVPNPEKDTLVITDGYLRSYIYHAILEGLSDREILAEVSVAVYQKCRYELSYILSMCTRILDGAPRDRQELERLVRLPDRLLDRAFVGFDK